MFQSVVDITIYYNGFHGDLNETYFVGEVDEESKQLVKVTYECINQAISAGTLTLNPVSLSPINCWKRRMKLKIVLNGTMLYF